MRYLLLEILNKANSIEDDDKRAEYLKPYMLYPLEVTLASFHNDNVKYDSFRKLNYKRGKPFGSNLLDSSIEVQVRKLYIFRNDYTIVPYEKKKEVLIKTLESMSAEEQDLYLNIIRKNNVYKNLGKVFVKHYFPHILKLDVRRP
ncbi:MAG: hypothetical protein N3A54_01715 [Patescibacteria group bacterium]|nr:hypothetical protein [Patescibacteria group bacterium]